MADGGCWRRRWPMVNGYYDDVSAGEQTKKRTLLKEIEHCFAATDVAGGAIDENMRAHALKCARLLR